MSQVIEMIDRRIARFSKPRLARQRSAAKNIKLNPLNHIPKEHKSSDISSSVTRTPLKLHPIESKSLASTLTLQKSKKKARFRSVWKTLFTKISESIKRPNWENLIDWKRRLQKACQLLSKKWKEKQFVFSHWKRFSKKLLLKKNLSIVKPPKKITPEMKIEAVNKIQKAYKRHLQREQMRTFRKYLWEVPYECRLLFIKFENVKRDTAALETNISKMIVKKAKKK